MEKLTLENIAPYLPYKMIGKSSGGRMYFLDTFSNMRGDGIENREIGTFINEQFKPILYSMDLTKPIQVDGKEIIPIVELAKIAFPEYMWNVDNGEAKATSDGVVCPRKHYFDFDNDSFKYFYVEKRGHYHTVPNQLSLFQWLFKHKFDAFGLIEKGLAIDVNTLENNPY